MFIVWSGIYAHISSTPSAVYSLRASLGISRDRGCQGADSTLPVKFNQKLIDEGLMILLPCIRGGSSNACKVIEVIHEDDEGCLHKKLRWKRLVRNTSRPLDVFILGIFPCYSINHFTYLSFPTESVTNRIKSVIPCTKQTSLRGWRHRHSPLTQIECRKWNSKCCLRKPKQRQINYTATSNLPIQQTRRHWTLKASKSWSQLPFQGFHSMCSSECACDNLF